MSDFSALKQLQKHFCERLEIPGNAMAVHRHGELLYEHFEGETSKENGKPVGPDTLYRIYSMTKPIACAAALILYERGLFALTDDIADYLPEFSDPQVYETGPDGKVCVRPAKARITIDTLFSMTSGLGGRNNASAHGRAVTQEEDKLPKNMRLGERISAVAKAPLAFDPGTHWLYGLSHDVLGKLIEVLTGMSLGEFLKKEIFDPLGMRNTAFRIPEAEFDRVCAMYRKNDSGGWEQALDMDVTYREGALYESAAGGLLSTLGDYCKFAQAMSCAKGAPRILSPRTIDLMRANRLCPDALAEFRRSNKEGYGYGLGVRTMMDLAEGGSNGSVGEYGWYGMAGTYALFDPDLGLSVIYMHQRLPSGEVYTTPRIRNAVYAAL